MRRVHRLNGELMHLVQHVEKVALGVDAHPFHAGHDLADDLLPGGCVGPVLERLQVRQQVGVGEVEERPGRGVLQFTALPADVFVRVVRIVRGCLFRRRAPIAPAVGRLQRRSEWNAQRVRFLFFAVFLLVEDAQEENPGQLGHILHRPGAVAPAHDVADALDGLIDRLLGGQAFAVVVRLILFLSRHRGCFYPPPIGRDSFRCIPGCDAHRPHPG